MSVKGVPVGLLLREAGAQPTMVELLTAAGMRIGARGEALAFWLVQDGEGVAARLQQANGAPIVLLRAAGDARPPTAAENTLGVARAIAMPEPGSLSSIWACTGQLLSVLRTLRGRAALVGGASAAVDPNAPALVAIAISTGGPPALEQVFTDLAGAELPPIVIVQHMPDGFVALLAQRLSHKTGYPVHVARDFQLLQRGHAYLAPATHHLVVGRRPEGLCCRLKDAPAVRGHRPAAEILFESLLPLGVKGLGVIMTGMGADGAQGLRALRDAGWATAGQDEASCAVYGMPKAARDLGATEITVPLVRIGAWIRQRAELKPVG